MRAVTVVLTTCTTAVGDIVVLGAMVPLIVMFTPGECVVLRFVVMLGPVAVTLAAIVTFGAAVEFWVWAPITMYAITMTTANISLLLLSIPDRVMEIQMVRIYSYYY